MLSTVRISLKNAHFGEQRLKDLWVNNILVKTFGRRVSEQAAIIIMFRAARFSPRGERVFVGCVGVRVTADMTKRHDKESLLPVS